jgi:hypothetical protein
MVMASLPPEPILPRSSAAHPADGAPAVLVQTWSHLHSQAQTLALLAGIAPEPEPARAPMTPLMEAAPLWQRNLAAQGIDDIAAMLGSGLAALATLSARGADTTAPALALWREFHAARGAILAMLHAEAMV